MAPKITPDLQARLDRLSTHETGFLSRLFRGVQVLSDIGEVGRSGLPAAIPVLIPHALRGRMALSSAASSSIAALIFQIAPSELPAFDLLVRGSLKNDWVSHRLEPKVVGKFARGPDATAMLGVFSMHPSGYVRAAAVEALSRVADGREMGFLLVRANDWVKAVRERAAAAIMERVRPENAQWFMHFLPLVLRLETWKRGQHAGLVSAVLQLLQRPECFEAVRAGLKSPDRRVCRASIRVVIELKAEVAEPFLKIALQSSDPVTRVLAAERLLRSISDDRLLDLCRELQQDASMHVRRTALHALAERLPAVADLFLREALLDRHSAVRQVAQFYLRDHAGFDCRAWYVSKISVGPSSIRAIGLLGLGEMGHAQDIDTVRPYLEAAELRIRKAALQAAARLAPAEVLPELLSALQDRSSGISRLASQLLVSQVDSFSDGALEAILRSSVLPHVRRNAFRLVLRQSKWDQLSAVLRFSVDEDSQLAQVASDGIKRWLLRYNRSYIPPSDRQAKEAENALAEVGPRLNQALCQNLRALLTEWKKK